VLAIDLLMILCSIDDITGYTEKNEQIRKYFVITLRYAILQGYMGVGYYPLYIYYKLLV